MGDGAGHLVVLLMDVTVEHGDMGNGCSASITAAPSRVAQSHCG